MWRKGEGGNVRKGEGEDGEEKQQQQQQKEEEEGGLGWKKPKVYLPLFLPDYHHPSPPSVPISRVERMEPFRSPKIVLNRWLYCTRTRTSASRPILTGVRYRTTESLEKGKYHIQRISYLFLPVSLSLSAPRPLSLKKDMQLTLTLTPTFIHTDLILI